MAEMTPQEYDAFVKRYGGKPAAPPPAPAAPAQIQKQSVFSRLLRDRGQQPGVTQSREQKAGLNE